MKLILAIVQTADAKGLLDTLMSEGYRATKISSTGGFLVRGNTTILIGVEDNKVDAVLSTLRKCCRARREFVSPVVPLSDVATARGWTLPVQVEVGGATAFVLHVERFEHL
ncbi:MAG: cyclic-di-AMP receptor [Chloroflexi bacterium]|nr:cyclic-di-AMP receptor [Chloroflexota bacterium]